MNNSKNKKLKYILTGILGISLFLGGIVPAFSEARTRAYDARIIADMSQIRVIAEKIYDEEDSYINFNCEYSEIKILCEDIERIVGDKPTIYQSTDKYCAYTKLYTMYGGYYCIDSVGGRIETYINPAGLNYCNGTTFNCPKEKGVPPPPPLEKKIAEITLKISLIGGGIIALGIITFVWVNAFRRRREEIIREENWALIKEEIKSKKWFYIFTILLVFSIILSLLLFTVGGGGYNLPFLLNFFLFYFLYFFPLFAPIGIFLSILRPIKKAWRDKAEMVCWENYVAPLCLGIFWLFFLYYFLLIPGELLAISVISFISIPFILGIGLSISALIHRGKLNKIIGIVILLTFLFSISPILLTPVTKALKYIGIIPDTDKAVRLASSNINKAVKECQKYIAIEDERGCMKKVIEVYQNTQDIKGMKLVKTCLYYQEGDYLSEYLCKFNCDYFYNWQGHHDLIYMYGYNYPEKAKILCEKTKLFCGSYAETICLQQIDGHIRETNRSGSALNQFLQQHPEGLGEP